MFRHRSFSLLNLLPLSQVDGNKPSRKARRTLQMPGATQITHENTWLGGAPRRAWLCLQRKKGEHKQAIGRSRGGRSMKIHAIAGAKGRLISVLLSGGDVHDCPPARLLIRRTRRAKERLADKAYDSAELRLWLGARGTTPVFPNRCNCK
jgi:DDE family transposase